MEQKHWNVVFVITDQQRADLLEKESNPIVYPNMERLNQESIRFSNCYPTGIPCASLRNNYLTGEERWIGILREHGYWFVLEQFRLEEAQEPGENYSDSHVAELVCDANNQLKDGKPFAMVFRFHSAYKPYVKPGRKFGIINDEMVGVDNDSYNSYMKMVDDSLDVILKKLEKFNLLKNTLLVYTNHGELIGEQCIFNKAGSFYEKDIRVPLLIRFPDGYKAGNSVSSLASTIDLAPTFLDIMGIRNEGLLSGYSLKPSIDEGVDIREYVTCTSNGAMMLRDKRYKFWYDTNTEKGEMYDLAADPMELDNIYGKVHCFDQQLKMMVTMLKVRLSDDIRNNHPLKQKAVVKRNRYYV